MLELSNVGLPCVKNWFLFVSVPLGDDPAEPTTNYAVTDETEFKVYIEDPDTYELEPFEMTVTFDAESEGFYFKIPETVSTGTVFVIGIDATVML